MSHEQRYLDLISGRSRGVSAALTRAGLSAITPLFRSAVVGRNAMFNTGVRGSVALGRPTISVGNITTGGTGKTPVVRWLVEQLRKRNRTPVVLLRGYGSRAGISDEAELYRTADICCVANPDRTAGAKEAVDRWPMTDTFILDDGFQHRQVARDVDIVLIDSTNPFGYGQLLPRGLLREPVSSLARAHAVLLTRVEPETQVHKILNTIREHSPTAEILTCRHVIRFLVDLSGEEVDVHRVGRVRAMAGIGNTTNFFDAVEKLIDRSVDRHPLPDHHVYTMNDIEELRRDRGKYDSIVVTEKDWVKLVRLPNAAGLPWLRAVLDIDFLDGHGQRLVDLCLEKIGHIDPVQ